MKIYLKNVVWLYAAYNILTVILFLYSLSFSLSFDCSPELLSKLYKLLVALAMFNTFCAKCFSFSWSFFHYSVLSKRNLTSFLYFSFVTVAFIDGSIYFVRGKDVTLLLFEFSQSIFTFKQKCFFFSLSQIYRFWLSFSIIYSIVSLNWMDLFMRLSINVHRPYLKNASKLPEDCILFNFTMQWIALLIFLLRTCNSKLKIDVVFVKLSVIENKIVNELENIHI